MYFCKKKTKHIFLFHASDRLHDQRKKKKPEVKADPKVQELQQRLEARKAGRLKRLFDNSDDENDNKLQLKHWAVKPLFKTFVIVHIITLPRWTDQNTSSSESSISKMRYETTEVLFFAHTGAHGYLLLVLLHHSVFAIFETQCYTFAVISTFKREKKRGSSLSVPQPSYPLYF